MAPCFQATSSTINRTGSASCTASGAGSSTSPNTTNIDTDTNTTTATAARAVNTSALGTTKTCATTGAET
ncbi:uncharacterized protein ColSpa_07980 [Colletotrichum spaethianum]|uniref:Uncharacterized protein n=1 Tax=Colletotrichum spaethianum TaxID=700344 RepID=A0AA37P8W4_9PEZI|nr:uncharacterized protein ColSpa_07980 [Colletotrichum spaethianum]GKT47799.1 hypothetical protein ColSpa_07980 [Colletotrichum spaethianum]